MSRPITQLKHSTTQQINLTTTPNTTKLSCQHSLQEPCPKEKAYFKSFFKVKKEPINKERTQDFIVKGPNQVENELIEELISYRLQVGRSFSSD
jgi:hypothetical protein